MVVQPREKMKRCSARRKRMWWGMGYGCYVAGVGVDAMLVGTCLLLCCFLDEGPTRMVVSAR